MAQGSIVKENWPLGWMPSADPLNGDPRGLQRMDNLRQDQTGVTSLVRGIQQVNKNVFPDFVSKIYSKNIAGNDVIWVSIGYNSSEIARSIKGDFTDYLVLGTGNDRACFGDCLGEVLSLAGQLRLKDDTKNVKLLGLATPGMPTVQSTSQPVLNIIGSWTAPEGAINSSGPASIYAKVDPTTLRGVVTLASPNNTLSIDGGKASKPNEDIFQFTFEPDDSSQVTSITVTAICDNNNYYQFSWGPGDLLQGPLQTSILTCKRGDFKGHGAGRGSTDHDLSWEKITSFQFQVVNTVYANFAIGGIAFYGGVQGQLNGTYTWIQVNVTNNGFYLAKSPPSVASPSATVVNGFVTLTPSPTEAQVTDIWYFRTTVLGSQVGTQSSFLNQYYQTVTGKPGMPVQDTTSDDDAIQINIVLNPFLLTLQAGDVNGIKESIYSVEGLYNERMLYMSATSLYLSDRVNPDAIDSRYTIKVSGDPTEFNIWVKRLTNNVLILSTSKNLYEISGTLLDLPDGTCDASVNAIGENYPPVGLSGADACSAAGSIFYVAADGVRATGGSNSQLISPQLNLLFQGETRSGIPGILINPSAYYPIVIGRGRLLVSLPMLDGSRWLCVYDLVAQTWRVQYTDPVSLFVTLTDRIFMGYNQSTSMFTAGAFYELDKLIEGGIYNSSGVVNEGYKVFFQTVYDNNQQPNNRKDTFTLKIVCDTGGFDMSVYLAPVFADNTPANPPTFIYIGKLNSHGVKTTYFDLSTEGVTLGFAYAVKIVDVLLTTRFDLYEITIDYDSRPEQLNFYRKQPDNIGSYSRKRFTSGDVIVIDTLGNTITYTPIVDNLSVGTTPVSVTFSTPVKQTFIYYFTEEVIGTDLSFILSGGVFELY